MDIGFFEEWVNYVNFIFLGDYNFGKLFVVLLLNIGEVYYGCIGF